MTRSLRTTTTLIHIVLLVALGGCASAPLPAPESVAVKADTLSPAYSSFNARVLADASVIENSFTASLEREEEPVMRLQTSYTQRLDGEGEVLRIGDAVSSVGMWGNPVRYGGMQFGTRTAPRDDVIASPRLATAGLAVLPTVEDALFAASGDPGAPLEAQNLSIKRSLRGGEGPWQLTARDADGRSEAVRAPIIAATRLVEEGCEDFSVGLGKVRRDYALTSNEYGPLFANTTVACAAPLGFTVEGHGEYLAEEVTALGVGVARPLGPIGVASFAVASSRSAEASGWLARFGFEHRNPYFDLLYRSRIQSREFREIGTMLRSDPIMERELASLGVRLGESSSFALAYASQTTWEQARTDLIALKQSVALGRGSLSMSAGRSLEDDAGSSLFISYKRPLGLLRRPPRPTVDEIDLAPLNRLMLPD